MLPPPGSMVCPPGIASSRLRDCTNGAGPIVVTDPSGLWILTVRPPDGNRNGMMGILGIGVAASDTLTVGAKGSRR